MKRLPHLLAALGLLLLAQPALTQTLSGDALIKALQRGGYVFVMRHASSPREAPTREAANPDNVKRERQLDDTGRATAAAMGQALRDLKIPIGSVVTSPTYRALQTVRLAGLPGPRTADELGDRGQSMTGVSEARAAWLKKQILERPKGTNTILVTHLPNMTAAFPQETTGLADGETLIFGPDGQGGARLVARLTIEQWSTMHAR
jgi:phosphohistidine phosphatase SixA